jgi:hypothetical protein
MEFLAIPDNYQLLNERKESLRGYVVACDLLCSCVKMAASRSVRCLSQAVGQTLQMLETRFGQCYSWLFQDARSSVFKREQ